MVKIKISDGREIEVKPLKTGQMRKALNQKLPMDQDIVMVSYATGLTVDEIDNLDWHDYGKLSEALADFIKKI